MSSTVVATKDIVKRRFTPTWRYLFNLGPTLEHRRRPPQLNEEARRVLADLERDGAARTTVEELTGDPTLLGRLQAYAAQLEAQREADLAEPRRQMEDGTYEGPKDFVIHLLGRHPTIDPKGLLAEVGLHRDIKGVADAYFGMRTGVADLNVWRTLVTDKAPRSSQMWHRDLMQDHYVLKVFIHLEDVKPGGGPFNYALGTHAKGQRRLALEAEFDGVAMRSNDDAMARAVPRERLKEFTGPAGTLLFADTMGYHRGGWATETPRLVFQALYASRASSRDYQLRLDAGTDPAVWDKDFILVGRK